MVDTLASAAPIMKCKPDPIKGIRAAGKFISTNGHNSDNCIRVDCFPREKKGNDGTPRHILKYRKLAHIDPGQILVHPGKVEDKQPVGKDFAYGKPMLLSDHVNEVIRAQDLTGLADKFNDTMESRYDTNKREPLGKSMTRSYVWPAAAEEGRTTFGLPTKDIINAKEILYPAGGALNEQNDYAEMYKRTHSNYYPGEQRCREYDWQTNPSIQGRPQTYSFGFGEQRLLDGVKKAIHHERVEDAFPKTTIVKKQVEDVRAVSTDMLGTVKNLGQSQTARGSDFIHGHKNDFTVWNAGKCITGEASTRELAPDADLGRSNKMNCSNNIRKPDDEHRSFGCPTVRTDVPFKIWRSVADYQNYGDEPEAVDLLYPATALEFGIQEADFQQLRSKDQIKALFEKIGHSFKAGKFNTLYNRAQELCDAKDGRVSVRSFLQSIETFKSLE